MKTTKISLTCFFAGTALCLGTPAGATSVFPGVLDTALTQNNGALTGYSQIANTGPQTYNDCATNIGNKHPTICGQYEEAVYQNNGNGTLDFVYQFSNGYAKAGVDAFSVSYFNDNASWATNAYYMNVEPAGFLGTPGCKYIVTGSPSVPVCDVGGVASVNIAPATVNESDDGSTLNFNFTKGSEAGYSSILIVQTLAKQYEPGGIAIHDSRNFNSFDLGLPGYQPAAVPEPGFYGVLSIGLAAIVCATTRRNKQRTNKSI